MVLFHVEIIAREYDPSNAPLAQRAVSEMLDNCIKKAKVTCAGAYADERGVFLILDIPSAEDMSRLWGNALEFATIKVHPIYPIESLKRLFKELEGYESQTPR